jgi:membrane-associated protease RseP (regulator of RpoE activity)
MGNLLGIILFVLALTIAIAIHEGGHYITAKWFGMKVERFFIGFGPTMWSFRRGETEYGIKWFPVGGFCKIAGMSPYEDDANFLESERRRPGDPPPEPVPPERQFRFKPAWQRWIVLAAGSVTHFIVAFLLLVLLLVGIGIPRVTNQVAAVIPEGPDGQATAAAQAGLRPGDRIVAVDGRRVDDDTSVRDAMAGTAGRQVSLTYQRDGQTRTTTLTPGSGGPGDRGFLGVEQTIETFRHDPVSGTVAATTQLWDITRLSVVGLGSLFQGLADRIEQPPAAEGGGGGGGGPIGIVGIARIAGDAVASDQWIGFLLLVVQFNVIIGVMNLLPIPPMDGGYIAFLAWEKLSGRPVDLRKVAPAMMLIVGLLLMLTFGLVWLDITNPVESPF